MPRLLGNIDRPAAIVLGQSLPDVVTRFGRLILRNLCASAELITGEGTLDKPEAGSKFDAVNARI